MRDLLRVSFKLSGNSVSPFPEASVSSILPSQSFSLSRLLSSRQVSNNSPSAKNMLDAWEYVQLKRTLVCQGMVLYKSWNNLGRGRRCRIGRTGTKQTWTSDAPKRFRDIKSINALSVDGW